MRKRMILTLTLTLTLLGLLAWAWAVVMPPEEIALAAPLDETGSRASAPGADAQAVTVDIYQEGDVSAADAPMASIVYYVDSDYTGSLQNGSASNPWSRIYYAEWGVINTALVSDDVTIYFSARDAGSDTDDVYDIDTNNLPDGVDLTQRTTDNNSTLTFDGQSFYNTNDALPQWSTYSGNAKSKVSSFTSQNDTHIKKNHITIDGFRIVSDGSGSGKALAICGDHYLITNCDISHTPNAANGPLVNIIPTADGAHEGSNAWCPVMTDLVIKNNDIHNSHGELIYVGGGGCSQNDPTGETHCMGFPAHSNIVIRNNKIHDGGSVAAQGDGIDVKGGIYNLTIAENEFYHIGVSQMARSIVIQGMNTSGPNQNIIIEKNYIHDTANHEDAAIAIVNSWGTPRNVVVRNNIIANNTRAMAIKVYDGTGIQIHNNTLYGNDEYGLYIADGDVAVVNNLFIANNAGNTQVENAQGALSSRHNGYSGTSWSGMCNNCYSGLSATEFINVASQDFHLKSTSTAVNHGESLTEFSDDYASVTRPQGEAWDIGAYEFMPELYLLGTPGNETIHLNWTVNTTIPVTTSWHIDYYTQTTTSPYTATYPFSTTRSVVLTKNVINYQTYTVTLYAMLDETPWLSDTVRVTPIGRFVYLPLVLK